jgi:diaminohydroxyphosphoribosylaminopyrimidine deaminase / 5-amino-6-(5-phosphoribosylamino)uracil reductase
MISSPSHETFMKRCFELALEGLGSVAPNPMVGSVIVYNNQIIGEGYHRKYGQPHAEVNAIESVTDKSLLKQSTLYVNLEPCSHYGKTPPCSDLIIKMGIPRVVISTIDPNPQIMGKGVEKLRNAGIEVVTEILSAEGEKLNKRFFTSLRKLRPYVILKWAQTKDGFIDIIRDPSMPQEPTWITNQFARMLVHKWRAEEQSILVGTNTALFDNPKLNIRNWVGNDPLRIVIDRTLRLPSNLHLFDNSIQTLVFTEKSIKNPDRQNIIYHPIVFDNHLLKNILEELNHRAIQSVFIEGGSKLIQSFISAGLWDEARVFTGDGYFTNGISAPQIKIKPDETDKWSGFTLDIYYNPHS